MNIHKDPNFGKLVPKRFISDALRNGFSRDIEGTKERNRRSEYEKSWIGNPQYGKYSMILGFRRWTRVDNNPWTNKSNGR